MFKPEEMQWYEAPMLESTLILILVSHAISLHYGAKSQQWVQPVEKRIDIQADVYELHIDFKLFYLLRKLMLTECNKWRHVSQQILIF